MAKLKLFIVRVEDWIPILFIVSGYSKAQILAMIKRKFPKHFDQFDFEVMKPIILNQGTFFAIDPELNVLDDDSEIKLWFDEEFESYAEDGEVINIEIEDDKSEEKSDEKIPEKEELQWA
jgi:hypothetical protein